MAPGARALPRVAHLLDVPSRGLPSVPREVERPGLNRPHDRESSTPTTPNTTSQVFATGGAVEIFHQHTGHSTLWPSFKDPIKSDFSWEWGEESRGFFFRNFEGVKRISDKGLPTIPLKFTPDERIGNGP